MRYYKYFTDKQYQQLLENGSDCSFDKDHPPVVKLHMTGTAAAWLISELNPEDPDIAFGLCDLGMGFPELGYVSIGEIQRAQNIYFLQHLERDESFKSEFAMSVYSAAARDKGCIETNAEIVKQYLPKPKL